jgi:hypothetical protein
MALSLQRRIDWYPAYSKRDADPAAMLACMV